MHDGIANQLLESDLGIRGNPPLHISGCDVHPHSVVSLDFLIESPNNLRHRTIKNRLIDNWIGIGLAADPQELGIMAWQPVAR